MSEHDAVVNITGRSANTTSSSAIHEAQTQSATTIMQATGRRGTQSKRYKFEKKKKKSSVPSLESPLWLENNVRLFGHAYAQVEKSYEVRLQKCDFFSPFSTFQTLLCTF